MKIVENNTDETLKELPETEDEAPAEVIQFKSKADMEKQTRVPIEEVLENAKKAGFSDIIIVGRREDGDMALSISADTGILAYYMLRRALFSIEHGMM